MTVSLFTNNSGVFEGNKYDFISTGLANLF